MSLERNVNLNAFKNNKLVVKKGVFLRKLNTANIDWFNDWGYVSKLWRDLNEILNVYDLSKNCSWENVLWAIGVFNLVVLNCNFLWIKKDGVFWLSLSCE